MTIRNLDYLFKPDTIALICGGNGDSEAIIIRNLMNGGFTGPIMPVDTKRWALAGALAYRDIASLPLAPALAIIARPLKEVPALIQQLGERGARAAVLISETRGIPQTERETLFQAILDAAEPYLLRVLGPASQGFSVPLSNLNVSLNRQSLLPGQIAFVTESGTIAQTALDIGNHYGFGFSHLIHLGDSLDVDLADILDYLAGDYRTRAILLYLEHIGARAQFGSLTTRAPTRAQLMSENRAQYFVIWGRFAKLMVLRFAKAATKAELTEMFRSGMPEVFSDRTPVELRKDAESFLRLLDHDVAEGQELRLHISDQSQIDVYFDSQKLAGPQNAKLARHLIEIWLGYHSAARSLRQVLIEKIEVLKTPVARAPK